MTNGSGNERMDRVGTNLDRVSALLIETAEHQRTNRQAIAELLKALEIDAKICVACESD